MKYFVTGAAGFIGSNVVDRLLADGHDVVGYDNLSTGNEVFLESALTSKRFFLHRADLLHDIEGLARAMEGSEFVFHFAANADVRFGYGHPRKDLEQNTIVTFNVLEAMQRQGIRRLAFSSTGSIYGEPEIFPTPEDAPFPIQTSLYGASKLACEGLIAAYCEGFGFSANIFRFVSILGARYTHGHVFDFMKQLQKDPHILTVLGDGSQRKSYLEIGDCVNAMFRAISEARSAKAMVLNLGTDQYCTVRDSIGWITDEIGVKPTLRFTGGTRGWIGDSPFIFLDTRRIKALGWRAEHSIESGVRRTVRYLLANPKLLER
jgi:UDP-glucose 4-epimerase